jgi:metacaspase-1
MNNAESLHIGINRVDSSHYGSELQLLGCHNDARDMAQIAASAGYQTTILLDDQATTINVSTWLKGAAKRLERSDWLLITFAGHGGQVADTDGEEADGLDETIVLYDRMLLDDELYLLLAGFHAGVKILFISDSCHSGTNYRNPEYKSLISSQTMSGYYAHTGGAFRTPGMSVTQNAFDKNLNAYRAATVSLPVSARTLVKASVVQLAACQDEQYAADGGGNGLFTTKLKQVWNGGAFKGSHRSLWQSIAREMPPTQSPNLVVFGEGSSEFESTRPFSPAITTASHTLQVSDSHYPVDKEATTERHDMNIATYRSNDDQLRQTQKELEHQLLRLLVENGVDDTNVNLEEAVSALRSVYQRRAALHAPTPADMSKRDPSAVLMAFGVKVITEQLSKIIASFEYLLTPAEGFVSFYNDTSAPVHVVTFDEKDALRWVPYEDRNVASRQVVHLTARGNVIHIKTPINGNVFDCSKQTAYFYDGNNVYAKTYPI